MIIPVPVHGKQKSKDICQAFVQGAPKDAFGYVFYGVDHSNMRDWHVACSSGEPWYYIDNSYFDVVRGVQYRVTKGALQVDIRGKESDGKRFEALGLGVRDRDYRDGYWLLVEQSPSFMRDLAREPGWMDRFKRVEHPIKIRPWERDKLAQQATLPKDIRDASVVVTHSSAAAVTATLMGVPVIVSQMSALYWMVEGYAEPLPAMQILADNQWTLDEIRSGAAWRHLNP